MYNGVEAAAVKGTGLSGYVQRSRVNISASAASRTAPLDESAITAAEGGASINPLEQRRAQAENAEMAARLQAHHALREVRLRVLRYREDREATGVDAATIERECGELYESLLTAAKRELKTQQRQEKAKSAAKFAAAFGVKAAASAGAGSGSAFDRSVQEVEKQRAELARRQQQEAQLAEHLKRVRREGAGEEEA